MHIHPTHVVATTLADKLARITWAFAAHYTQYETGPDALNACSGTINGITASPNLDQLMLESLRALAAQLLTQVDAVGKKIHLDQTIIEQLICTAWGSQALALMMSSMALNGEGLGTA